MYCRGFAVYHLIGCEVNSLRLCYIVGVFSQWYQFASYPAGDWCICANIALVLGLCAPLFCLPVGDTL